jgi:hypothetical protein
VLIPVLPFTVDHPAEWLIDTGFEILWPDPRPRAKELDEPAVVEVKS